MAFLMPICLTFAEKKKCVKINSLFSELRLTGTPEQSRGEVDDLAKMAAVLLAEQRQ